MLSLNSFEVVNTKVHKAYKPHNHILTTFFFFFFLKVLCDTFGYLFDIGMTIDNDMSNGFQLCDQQNLEATN
jgi:CDP-diglyceride synthetase